MLTVVRLPNPGNARDPLELLASTVARTDLALADALHAGCGVRPFACARRREAVDVVAGLDAIARALMAGEPAARLVRRVALAELVAGPAPARLRLAFVTPTAFRAAGLDHLLPDPAAVFGSLRARWAGLGWPALPAADLRRVAAQPELLRFGEQAGAGGERLRGCLGVVRYELVGLEPAARAALWALARFGEYRGVGRGTSYGLGRVRILRPGEPWRPEGWDGGPA
jgi:hypothetical protein